MNMRSWRVRLGSFWAHVEIMWSHFGHLGRTWGTCRGSWRTKAAWRRLSSAKGCKREPKMNPFSVKRGTRVDKGRQGFGSAGGWLAGGGGDNKLVPDLAKSMNSAHHRTC